MRKQRAGFTLVELLVVIAIIALLMGILMPALAKVRHIAYRMVCGSNAGGIGKAMMVYANDNKEDYPRAGGRNSSWANAGSILLCNADTPDGAFQTGGSGGRMATVTSCFYLLVRLADIPPKQFVCKGDTGTKELKLTDLQLPPDPRKDFQDLYDFTDSTKIASGGYPGAYCSYSYQDPFCGTNLTGANPEYARPASATSAADLVVVADRNPMYDKNVSYYKNADTKANNTPSWKETPPPPYLFDPDKTMNSASHQRDGQNVLYNDSHVSFELMPNCGIDKDNIWEHWPQGSGVTEPTDLIKQFGETGGTAHLPGEYGPQTDKDSWLICERQDIPR